MGGGGGGGGGVREQPLPCLGNSRQWAEVVEVGEGAGGCFVLWSQTLGYHCPALVCGLRQVTRTLGLSFPFLKWGRWRAVGDAPLMSDWEVSGLRAPLKAGATQSGRGLPRKIGVLRVTAPFPGEEMQLHRDSTPGLCFPRSSGRDNHVCWLLHLLPGCPTLPAPPGPARGLHCK